MEKGFCTMPITSLVKADWNYKTNNEALSEKLANNIKRNGQIENIIIRELDTGFFEVVNGNHRLDVLKSIGYLDVHCFNLGSISESQAKRIAVETNETRFESDIKLLSETITSILEEFSLDEIEVTMPFTEDELNKLLNIEIPLNEEPKTKPPSLADVFVVPPLSILDTRQGYWQDRKRYWIGLGIESELGRDNDILCNSKIPEYAETWKHSKKYKGIAPHVSIFDPVLCEICYKWFNIPNGNILDCFSGGSVRGIVAAKLGMQYTGVDLSDRQITENNVQGNNVLTEEDKFPKWVCGDSVDIKKHLPDYRADLLFSCPPYVNLEVYSDDIKDISNMEYDEFIKAYRLIVKESCDMLNDNRFAIFTISEVRGKTGEYHNFVGDTISAFLDAGLHYYNEMILIGQIGTVSIRAAKTFNAGRKVGKCHQNVLVFYKGNIKKIKENYPKIIIEEINPEVVDV